MLDFLRSTSLSPPNRQSMPLKTLHPRWFISRGNGVMVPLIAADELPEGIRLQGVSCSLTLGEVRGMECLGGFPPITTVYNVESGSAHPVIPCAPEAAQVQSRFQAPDAMVRKFRSTPILGTTFPYQSNTPRLEASMTHPGSPKPQQPSLLVLILLLLPASATFPAALSHRREPHRNKKRRCIVRIGFARANVIIHSRAASISTRCQI